MSEACTGALIVQESPGEWMERRLLCLSAGNTLQGRKTVSSQRAPREWDLCDVCSGARSFLFSICGSETILWETLVRLEV